MSLNEAPVSVNIMAKLHQLLREKLLTTPTYMKVVPDTVVSQMDEFHLEYWTLKDQHPTPWIFITIGNLFHPPIAGSYNMQVVPTVPKEVWDNEKYSHLKKFLEITDPMSQDRDYRFEQIVSRSLSKFSFSKGVTVRDDGALNKICFKEYTELKLAVNNMIAKKQEIIDAINKALDEYITNAHF